jgi:hypothetical protein
MLFKLHRANGALNSPSIFAAVEQGIRAAGYSVTESQADIEVIWSVLWQGRMKPNQLIYERCIKNKKPVMIIEVGNLVRGQTWRLSFDHINGLGKFANDRDLDPKRPRKLGVELKPEKYLRSDKILLACQHEHSLQWQLQPRMDRWVELMISKIREHTDRKIVVRPHPRSPFSLNVKGVEISRPKPIKGSYDSFDFSDDFHCVVNHNSGPAVQAAINGTPVITDSTSLAYPVSDTLANIESVKLPDRESWFLDLCHTEWTVPEIMSGVPIRRLVESLK